MTLCYFRELPQELTEPLYYLGPQQRVQIQSCVPKLHALLPFLPCWVPHRLIAQALGYSEDGIQNAIQWNHGQPYLWGTEFENVHSFWDFDEPSFVVDGIRYEDSEDFYQRQKPQPFDALRWDAQRDDVMRRALEKKFQSSVIFRSLLMSTHPFPLLSLKRDAYWGVNFHGQGENRLAQLLMEIRQQQF